MDVTKEISLQIGHLVSTKSGCFLCGGSIPIATPVDGGGSSVALSSPSARLLLKEEPAEVKGAQPSKTVDGEPTSDEKTMSKPVTIRWDSAAPLPSGDRKVLFPLSANGAGRGKARLEALLRDCQPATFGRGSEAILDETYRKIIYMLL